MSAAVTRHVAAGLLAVALALPLPRAAGGVGHAAPAPTPTVSAATTPGASPATGTPAPPPLVAILPLGALTEGAGSRATIETLVHSAARGFVPQVLSAAEVHATLATAHRAELEACDGQPPCLAELGQVLGATTIVDGEVGAIGDGLVLYLEAFDVVGGVPRGSTTATLQGDPTARATAVRAAVARLLAPARHAGTLAVRADRAGSQVFVDGRLLGATPLDAPLAAGTHALRVTHPEARDLVRFVDVPFEQVTRVDATMVPLPIVKDLIDARGARARGEDRRGGGWWGPVLVGAGAAVLTTVIVLSFGGGLDVDDSVSIDPP